MITIDKLKEKIEKIGYYATEELIYDAFNALCMFNDKNIDIGQDIYAICLEGPPGAGKTEFAKTYTKLANELFNSNVEMVDYQCDATTGKTELFEDINISAAISRDAEHVNIPGKLVDAINRVNNGKKVVLFIDEYDKAREETDAFLLQFLQSGKINSTQHGDLAILDGFKTNLQVILCKNDMRDELSGPLSRRIRIIRLDYMKPEIFHKIAYRNLIEEKENKVNDGLLNLVSLIYEQAYSSREIYDRLPSCSEMLIAIQDADRLLNKANAPQHIIYNTIIKNMFKSPDDIKTFEAGLNNKVDKKESKLSSLISSMKDVDAPKREIDLNSLIAQKIFTDQSSKLAQKTQEMQQLIDEYKMKFSGMEAKRKAVIEKETNDILLQGGKLISTNVPNTIGLFEDESARIKRGFNIFENENQEWTDIGEVNFPYLSRHLLIDKMRENVDKLDITLFENGILLKEDEKLKLIVVNDYDEDKRLRYRFMSSCPVIPSTYLKDISNFIDVAEQVNKEQPQTANKIAHEAIGVSNGIYDINALVYNDSEMNFETVLENVYNVKLSGRIRDDKPINFSDNLECVNINKAVEVSNKITSGKGKVLTNE